MEKSPRCSATIGHSRLIHPLLGSGSILPSGAAKRAEDSPGAVVVLNFDSSALDGEDVDFGVMLLPNASTLSCNQYRAGQGVLCGLWFPSGVYGPLRRSLGDSKGQRSSLWRAGDQELRELVLLVD